MLLNQSLTIGEDRLRRVSPPSSTGMTGGQPLDPHDPSTAGNRPASQAIVEELPCIMESPAHPRRIGRLFQNPSTGLGMTA
jgi:hypothetical protein